MTASRYSRAGEEEQNVQCETRKERRLHGHARTCLLFDKRWAGGQLLNTEEEVKLKY